MEQAKVKLGPAARFVRSLELKPLCDSAHAKNLTPEQQAALHAFLHEFLAAYYRMRILVPEDRANAILDSRFAKAAER